MVHPKRATLKEAMKGKALGKVVVLPDFFLDRIVKLGSLTKSLSLLREKAASGGGVIHRIGQMEVKGGNAVNTAFALGRLGVKTTLITLADENTSGFLRQVFSDLPEVTLRIREGRPGYTVALELDRRGRRVNIMLGDPGDMSDFGFERLGREELRAISEADITSIFNWAANAKGTQLSAKTFTLAKRKGRMTYCDPSDITLRGEEFTEFMTRVLREGLVDVLSLNENEARFTAKLLGFKPMPKSYSESDVIQTAKLLSRELSTRIDLHTPSTSCTVHGAEAYHCPAFKVEQHIATGAGDVWNAANIVGYLRGFEADQRLTLANACAALFVSNPRGEPPSMGETLRFLSEQLRKTEEIHASFTD